MKKKLKDVIKGYFFTGAGCFSLLAGGWLLLSGGVFDEHIGLFLGIALVFSFGAFLSIAFDFYWK